MKATKGCVRGSFDLLASKKDTRVAPFSLSSQFPGGARYADLADIVKTDSD